MADIAPSLQKKLDAATEILESKVQGAAGVIKKTQEAGSKIADGYDAAKAEASKQYDVAREIMASSEGLKQAATAAQEVRSQVKEVVPSQAEVVQAFKRAASAPKSDAAVQESPTLNMVQTSDATVLDSFYSSGDGSDSDDRLKLVRAVVGTDVTAYDAEFDAKCNDRFGNIGRGVLIEEGVYHICARGVDGHWHSVQ